ncbi:Protein of unknown function [Bacillus cereus]|nr:Protein of unknown function [Bacillus cereus]
MDAASFYSNPLPPLAFKVLILSATVME